jgi:hypothetical protein
MDNVTQIRMKMGLGESDYDFYRCYKCQRLITRLEEIQSFSKKSKKPGKIFKCGSPKYSPSNLRWYEWFYPRVLRFAYYRIRRMV